MLRDEPATVRNVLPGILRPGLPDNARLGNAMPFQIVGHALRFGERLIRALAAGHDADGLRIGLKIVDGLIKPVLQYKTWAGPMHLRAKHDHIIQSRLAGGTHTADHETLDRAETDQSSAQHHGAHPSRRLRHGLPPAEPGGQAYSHEHAGNGEPYHPKPRARMRRPHMHAVRRARQRRDQADSRCHVRAHAVFSHSVHPILAMPWADTPQFADARLLPYRRRRRCIP